MSPQETEMLECGKATSQSKGVSCTSVPILVLQRRDHSLRLKSTVEVVGCFSLHFHLVSHVRTTPQHYLPNESLSSSSYAAFRSKSNRISRDLPPFPLFHTVQKVHAPLPMHNTDRSSVWIATWGLIGLYYSALSSMLASTAMDHRPLHWRKNAAATLKRHHCTQLQRFRSRFADSQTNQRKMFESARARPYNPEMYWRSCIPNRPKYHSSLQIIYRFHICRGNSNRTQQHSPITFFRHCFEQVDATYEKSNPFQQRTPTIYCEKSLQCPSTSSSICFTPRQDFIMELVP